MGSEPSLLHPFVLFHRSFYLGILGDTCIAQAFLIEYSCLFTNGGMLFAERVRCLGACSLFVRSSHLKYTVFDRVRGNTWLPW
jgi:hypothetical protein